MQLEQLMSWCDWHELQHLGAIAAEAEALGVSDLQHCPPLASLAAPLLERARQRHVAGRTPSRIAPVDAGFRTMREVHEHAMRAALWTGERYACRLFPFFDDLTDEELERLWNHIAAVFETTGLTKDEQADANTLACRVKLGIHRATWPIIAGIVDAHRVHENGGAEPDYDSLIAPLLAASLAI